MYLVTEIQVNHDSTVGNNTFAYQEVNQAWNKYYTVLAAAAVSNVHKHSAILYTEDGFIAQQCFTHELLNEE